MVAFGSAESRPLRSARLARLAAMKVLITGGAGYIGSTVATACIEAGIEVVVLDDLSTGLAAFGGDATSTSATSPTPPSSTGC